MEANPYQSPLEVSERAEVTAGSPRFVRARIAACIIGLIGCTALVVYAMLMIGTLAWLTATPASPGQLAEIRWWFKFWLWVMACLVSTIMLLSFAVWRDFRRLS